MVTHPMQEAAIVKAPGCPHYVLRSAFEAWHANVGTYVLEPMRCRWCQERRVTQFGQFGKSGPTSRVRTTKDPAGKGYLKRRNRGRF